MKRQQGLDSQINTLLTYSCLHNNMGGGSPLTSEAVEWQGEKDWQMQARAEERNWVKLRWSQRIIQSQSDKWEETTNTKMNSYTDKPSHDPEAWCLPHSSWYSEGLMDRLMDCWQRAQLALPVLNSLVIVSPVWWVSSMQVQPMWSGRANEQKMWKHFTAQVSFLLN